MARDSRYDILFEPIQIGPVTSKNRFYQVPHCNGMGHRDPTALAVMRGVKAEGGWGVVCTEQVDFHPSAEITPYVELRLWDDKDIPMFARMMDHIHEHGALGGIELCHAGLGAANRYSRETPLGPVHLPVMDGLSEPTQARAMTRRDIQDFRRWHKDAALRAKTAGADIVYVYAGKYFSGLTHWLSHRYNYRDDEYGGCLNNRVRLLREVIADTKEAVGDKCGVVCRISIDDLTGEAGMRAEESIRIIEMLDDYPDAWDLTLSPWENDSQTSRFSSEGYQEPFVTGFKQVSKKPIIGTGRFTSPDTMVSQIKRGIIDMIGAARPSIADPFLPNKIYEGRIDDIRECIGCNICVSGDHLQYPMRCTQNPTMSEEWRRGWHPERIARKATSAKVLVVGAGPTGLEATLALGNRGYDVVLAEATRVLGGRVEKECQLPGLREWSRVRDYRKLQIQKMKNVSIYFESGLDASSILSFGFDHVALCTGAFWRKDAVARYHTVPIEIHGDMAILTPDDLMSDHRPPGHKVVLYDDDHYYMGGVLAELLVKQGYEVSLVTPAADVSHWTHKTMEQNRIQTRVLQCGITVVASHAVVSVARDHVVTQCIFTGSRKSIECDAIVMVTSRLPNDEVYLDLVARNGEWADSGISTVRAIGDAWAPATIATAVFEGHRYARELENPEFRGDHVPFRRETVELVAPELI